MCTAPNATIINAPLCSEIVCYAHLLPCVMKFRTRVCYTLSFRLAGVDFEGIPRAIGDRLAGFDAGLHIVKRQHLIDGLAAYQHKYALLRRRRKELIALTCMQQLILDRRIE